MHSKTPSNNLIFGRKQFINHLFHVFIKPIAMSVKKAFEACLSIKKSKMTLWKTLDWLVILASLVSQRPHKI